MSRGSNSTSIFFLNIISSTALIPVSRLDTWKCGVIIFVPGAKLRMVMSRIRFSWSPSFHVTFFLGLSGRLILASDCTNARAKRLFRVRLPTLPVNIHTSFSDAATAYRYSSVESLMTPTNGPDDKRPLWRSLGRPFEFGDQVPDDFLVEAMAANFHTVVSGFLLLL